MCDCSYTCIPIREYSDEEMKAIEIIDYLKSSEDIEMMSNILNDVVNNANDDVIGVILNYEYVML